MTEYTTAGENGHEGEQSTDIEDRTRRALAERLTVLTPDGTPVENPNRTSFSVTSASGATYQVNLATETCDCDDAEYRAPAGGCKHVRRCRVATGRDPVPAAVDAERVAEVSVREWRVARSADDVAAVVTAPLVGAWTVARRVTLEAGFPVDDTQHLTLRAVPRFGVVAHAISPPPSPTHR